MKKLNCLLYTPLFPRLAGTTDRATEGAAVATTALSRPHLPLTETDLGGGGHDVR